MSHRPVIDFIQHLTDLFHITQDNVVGNQTPFNSDVSAKDTYSALKTEVTMEIIPKKLFSILTGLLDYLCNRRITTAIWAVSALCIITTLKGFTYRIPSHLNKILFSREAIPVKYPNIRRSYLPDALLVDLCGPTEVAYNCTYYVVGRELEPGTPPPIGVPSPSEIVSPLDENNRLVTGPGQNGGLYVAGTALASGYYGDPKRTAIAFVQNPLDPYYPEIICRAGGLTYCGGDGLLYFNGRRDLQIKHMGHRVELSKIEAALETVEGVDKTVCLFLEKKNKVAAFYEETAVKRDIAVGLEHLLPHYMFPVLCRNLTELSRTKNGKADRQALRRLYG